MQSTFDPKSVENFDGNPQEFYFTVTNKDTGHKELFVLVEFDGTQRDQYLDSLNKRSRGGMSASRSEPIRISSIEGIQADLLIRCLFNVEAEENSEGTLVPVEDDNGKQKRTPVNKKMVQGWRSGLLQKIHEKATELCGLGNEDEEEETAKND